MSRAIVHPSSVIDEDVQIGEFTRIWLFCHVQRGARIGRGCVLGQNVNIGPGVSLGDRVKVQNNVSVFEGVTIEDEVFLGPSCVFTNVRRPRAFLEQKHAFAPTIVRRGASVGANATVICPVELGRYCFVGAGAVVTEDVPPHALVVGAPARRIAWVCRCGQRLGFERALAGARVACEDCGARFERVDEAGEQRVELVDG